MPQSRVRGVGRDVGDQHGDDIGQAEDHAETLDQDIVARLHALHDQCRQAVIAEIDLDHDHAGDKIGKVQRNDIDNRADGVQQRVTENDPLSRHAFQDRHLDIGRRHHIQHRRPAHPDKLRGDDETERGDRQREMGDQLEQALAFGRADDNGVADAENKYKQQHQQGGRENSGAATSETDTSVSARS